MPYSRSWGEEGLLNMLSSNLNQVFKIFGPSKNVVQKSLKSHYLRGSDSSSSGTRRGSEYAHSGRSQITDKSEGDG